MRKRLVIATSLIILTVVLLGSLTLGARSFLHPGAAAARGAGVSHGSVTAHDMHALFFVWASGTPAVQQLAAQDCVQLTLTAAQCDSVSADVRATWLELADRDRWRSGVLMSRLTSPDGRRRWTP
jgi:hypothetical protein